MFKKSLIALALATAAMSANAANTITTNNDKNAAHKISAESLTAARTAIVPSVDVVLDDAFDTLLIDGAKLVITVSGAVFNSTADASSLNLSGQFATAGGAEANTGSTLTYELAGKANSIDDGEKITIPALPVIFNENSTKVSYVVSFLTSGDAPTPGTTTGSTEVATVVQEWSLAFGKLDAKINVEDDRETFVGEGAAQTSDVLELKFGDVNTAGGAALSSVEVVIKGDFTDIVSVKDSFNNEYVVNNAKTTATFTYLESAAPLTASDLNTIDTNVTLTVKSGDDAVELTEQEFKVDATIKYNTNQSIELATDAAAGEWTLNSTSTTLNYAPFGPNTQLIVNATSDFDEAASVDVTYIKADGKPETLTDIATVEPNAVTKLGDIISDAIIADTGADRGKTKITVSVNAPEGDVSFFTGFKDLTDGSRMELQQVDNVANDTLAAAKAAVTAANTAATAASNTASSNQTAVLNAITGISNTLGDNSSGLVQTVNGISSGVSALSPATTRVVVSSLQNAADEIVSTSTIPASELTAANLVCNQITVGWAYVDTANNNVRVTTSDNEDDANFDCGAPSN
ncbi:hypothetical protein DXX93_05670 [Thalassotalea euphylliae]|uniref:Uncharacterized protein n=1 Tax=Thalassotalea euphylliae TaxID=1655234 RepID=A0A3E0TNK5_9GAMM|nr:hypothetical protein [Thalassotalea euphylliae]REL26114.1 hypothetical protein DXX93_05670 [Thalassotalea euphylliae]